MNATTTQVTPSEQAPGPGATRGIVSQLPKRDCRLWVIAVAVRDGCCDLGERYWTPESDKEDANARSLEPGGVSRVVSI